MADYDPFVFEASAGAWLDGLGFPLAPAELASLALGIERLCVELASRFAADALRESYFGWNRDLFETAGAHNLSRTRGQLSLHDQARASSKRRSFGPWTARVPIRAPGPRRSGREPATKGPRPTDANRGGGFPRRS